MADIPSRGHRTPAVLLTIAGFDPSNGAGITADLQVFAAHGFFGTSAITALTVQSTQGVAAVHSVAPEVLRHTLDHLLCDLPPDGIKIGMLGSAENTLAICDFLHALSDIETCRNVPVILDPVLKSSSGTALLTLESRDVLTRELLPLVSWMTPNVLEMNEIAGDHHEESNREQCLAILGQRFPNLQIIATGGDEEGHPTDSWRSLDGQVRNVQGNRIHTKSTHGTGCAFSSALLCRLVQGMKPAEAIVAAKTYVEGALHHAPDVGHGTGPLGLLWPVQHC